MTNEDFIRYGESLNWEDGQPVYTTQGMIPFIQANWEPEVFASKTILDKAKDFDDWIDTVYPIEPPKMPKRIQELNEEYAKILDLQWNRPHRKK